MSDDAPKSAPRPPRSAPPAPAEAASPELAASAARAADLINPLERQSVASEPPSPTPAPPVNTLHEWAVAAALMVVLSCVLLWFVWFFQSGGFL